MLSQNQVNQVLNLSTSPKLKIIANPPFSNKSWSNGVDVNNDPYERFSEFGAPPEKNGDYAFLLHIIKSLKPNTGKAAVILPHGVLFRGNAEEEIRTKIIDRGLIKGIIGLPANLFYGTGIPACIIVIDKEGAYMRDGIFMIDASKGFIKDGNKNRLRDQDIHKIVDVFENAIEIPKYSRMVPMDEIKNENEYNLNIPRYIDSSEEEDLQDISAHLLGGIPNRDIDNLEKYWSVYPNLKNVLFSKSDRDGYCNLNIGEDDIKDTIYRHEEFTKHQMKINNVFYDWREENKDILNNINENSRPKEIIKIISEDILKRFKDVKLIDEYDVYQSLMSYWNEVMHDDVYLIVSDGWKVGNEVEYIYTETKKKDGTVKRSASPKDYDGKLIPKDILIELYFYEERGNINSFEREKDAIAQNSEEIIEECCTDEELFADVVKDNKISKANVKNIMKNIKADEEKVDVYKALEKYLELIEDTAKIDKKIKELEEDLKKKVLNKYKSLTIEEIKNITINEKWMSTLSISLDEISENISQTLTSRIIELAKRYESPLPQIENEVKELESKVEEHLKRMGFTW